MFGFEKFFNQRKPETRAEKKTSSGGVPIETKEMAEVPLLSDSLYRNRNGNTIQTQTVKADNFEGIWISRNNEHAQKTPLDQVLGELRSGGYELIPGEENTPDLTKEEDQKHASGEGWAKPPEVTEKRQLELTALHLREKEREIPSEVRVTAAKELAKLEKRKRAATQPDVVKARTLRKGILQSVEQKKIDAAERARSESEERLAEEEKLIRIGDFKKENPGFYRTYDQEMEKLERTFIREFEATKAAQIFRERSFAKNYGRVLRSAEESPEREEAKKMNDKLEEFGRRVSKIVEDFNALDDRLPEDGLRGLMLLSELRGMAAEMSPKAQARKKKVLEEQEKGEYASEYPNAERIENEHTRILIKQEVKSLERNCGLVRSRKLYLTKNFRNIGQVEEAVKTLSSSLNVASSLEEVEKILESLQEIENVAFSEMPPEKRVVSGSKKDQTRKLREEEREMAVPSKDDKRTASDKRSQLETLESETDEPALVLEKQREGTMEDIKKLWADILGNSKKAKEISERSSSPAERDGRIIKINELLEKGQKVALIPNGAGIQSRMEVLQEIAQEMSTLAVVTEEQKEEKKEEEKKTGDLAKFGGLLVDGARSIYEKIDELPLDMMPQSAGLYTTRTVKMSEGEVSGAKSCTVRIFLPKDQENGLLAAYEALPSGEQSSAEEMWLDTNYNLESQYLGKIFLIALEQVKKYWEKKISDAKTLSELDTVGHVYKKQNRTKDERGQKGGHRTFIRTEHLYRKDLEEVRQLRRVLLEAQQQRKRALKDDVLSFEDIFRKQLQPAMEAANRQIFNLWEDRLWEISGKRGKRPRKEETSFETRMAQVKEKIVQSFDTFFPLAIAAVEESLKKEGQPPLMLLFKQSPKKAVEALGNVGEGVNEVAQILSEDLAQDEKEAVINMTRELGEERLVFEMEKIAGLLEFKG